MKVFRNVRIVVPAFLLVVALMIATTTVALANGGPHEGTFTPLSDSCAGCHRVHTASAGHLLKSISQYTLCMSCHDGTGANTKETTGVYLGTTNGTNLAGLRGGGFEANLLNTAMNGTGNWSPTGTPAPVTSRHSVNATNTIIWGSGAVGNTSSGVGETLVTALTCGNCHNPHGNGNFRILKDKPVGWSATLGAVSITDNLSGNYTIAYTVNNTRNVVTAYSGNSSSGIGPWCAQCHTKYNAGVGAGSTNSTASSFNFRHMTDGIGGECFACHMAHSTSANMSGWAGNSSLLWPNNSTSVAWNTAPEGQYSRLLNINNRGVCLQCHSSAALTGG